MYIQYRAKKVTTRSKDISYWAYGDLKRERNKEGIRNYIVYYVEDIEYEHEVFVHEHTIQMCTGLKDIEETYIYQGDIFKDDDVYLVVEWDEKEARFIVAEYGYQVYHGENSQEIEESTISRVDHGNTDMSYLTQCKIIGNTIDNKNLIG